MFFGEQGVDGFDGADYAAFDAAQGYIKDFQRARHLQANKTGLCARRRRKHSSHNLLRCQAAVYGCVEVQRTTNGVVTGARESDWFRIT